MVSVVMQNVVILIVVAPRLMILGSYPAVDSTVAEHSTNKPKIEGSNPASTTSVLYYKHIMIANDASIVNSKWCHN